MSPAATAELSPVSQYAGSSSTGGVSPIEPTVALPASAPWPARLVGLEHAMDFGARPPDAWLAIDERVIRAQVKEVTGFGRAGVTIRFPSWAVSWTCPSSSSPGSSRMG